MKVFSAVMAALMFAGCGEMRAWLISARMPEYRGARICRRGRLRKSSGPATEGRPMPDHGLQCLGEGPTVSMSRATSRGVTVVTIWASWCRPCRSEAPLIANAYRRYHDRVHFLGIDYAESDASEAISFAGDAGLTFPHLQDPDSTIQGAWQISGVPVTFIVRDGTIVTRHSGQWRSQRELDSAIDKVIKRTP
ncbi:hypothetical protein JCM18916_1061 [Cutibacterium acnes JCM 18916]|nr:hypothetical protein JCM18916_1061 [Cutibacterium acnes JCM 18916]